MSEPDRADDTSPPQEPRPGAIVRVLEKDMGLDVAKHAYLVAGHSLGEYSALCAAGGFSSIILRNGSSMLSRITSSIALGSASFHGGAATEAVNRTMAKTRGIANIGHLRGVIGDGHNLRREVRAYQIPGVETPGTGAGPSGDNASKGLLRAPRVC